MKIKEAPPRNRIGSQFKIYTRMVNGRILEGYSAREGWGEKSDSADNLLNFIIRIGIKSEYLVEGTSRKSTNGNPIGPIIDMTVCHNRGIDSSKGLGYDDNKKIEWHPFLQLTYKQVKWLDESYREYYQGNLQQKLSRLYDLLLKKVYPGIIASELYISKHSQRVDPLDVSKNWLNGENELIRHCQDLLARNAYAEEVITHFYHTYKQKYFKP
jgi:hypothetical protein